MKHQNYILIRMSTKRKKKQENILYIPFSYVLLLTSTEFNLGNL